MLGRDAWGGSCAQFHALPLRLIPGAVGSGRGRRRRGESKLLDKASSEEAGLTGLPRCRSGHGLGMDSEWGFDALWELLGVGPWGEKCSRNQRPFWCVCPPVALERS